VIASPPPSDVPNQKEITTAIVTASNAIVGATKQLVISAEQAQGERYGGGKKGGREKGEGRREKGRMEERREEGEKGKGRKDEKYNPPQDLC
jgi:hypothetical protein